MSAERMSDERLVELERWAQHAGGYPGHAITDLLAEVARLRQIEEAARRLVHAQDAVNQISSRQYWATGEDARAADAEFRDAGDAFDAVVRAALPEAPQDQPDALENER